MLRLLVRQRCHKVLNDNRSVTNMRSEAAEWVGKDWFPAMMTTDLRYFAWGYPLNIYSRLPTDLTLQFTPGNAVIVPSDDGNSLRLAGVGLVGGSLLCYSFIVTPRTPPQASATCPIPMALSPIAFTVATAPEPDRIRTR